MFALARTSHSKAFLALLCSFLHLFRVRFTVTTAFAAPQLIRGHHASPRRPGTLVRYTTTRRCSCYTSHCVHAKGPESIELCIFLLSHCSLYCLIKSSMPLVPAFLTFCCSLMSLKLCIILIYHLETKMPCRLSSMLSCSHQ